MSDMLDRGRITEVRVGEPSHAVSIRCSDLFACSGSIWLNCHAFCWLVACGVGGES